MNSLGRAAGSILAIATLAIAPVSADRADAADNIVVGFAVAKSGWMEIFDTPAKNAAQLKIDEINASGGLLGRQITTIEADTKTEVAEGAKAAESLLDQGVDMLVVSCDYDMGVSAALAAERAGVVSFFLCAEDIKAGKQGVGPHSFTGSVVANVQGATMADWAYEDRKAKSAYLLIDTSIEYNKSVCAGFEWQYPQLDGAAIVGKDTFVNSDASIASQITRIKSLPQEPDVIMMCSYAPGGASAAKQIRAAGIKSAILNGTAMDGTYWLDAAPGLKDFFVTVQGSVRGDDPRPEVNAFVQAYAAKYGAPPPNQALFGGVVLIEMWKRAVEAANAVDADSVTGELEKLTDVSTLVGTRSFTPDLHIQNIATYLISSVDNGKVTVVGEKRLKAPIPLDVLMARH